MRPAMTVTIEKTLDPVAHETRDDGEARMPAVEILFHPDLSRIGAVALLPSAAEGDVLVGRAQPLFADADGQRAIDDPCISRQQLSIRWLEGEQRFRIGAPSGARRSVAATTLAGEPLDPDQPVPPGTLVAVGDRLLLHLALRPDRRRQDRMGMVGESEAIWTLRTEIAMAAAVDRTVLLEGESGVGKELAARAIHKQSDRRQHPLLVVNCAAIPDNLLESELFGHVRGAFTGATESREGFFRAAGKGTLFLDEIGELPRAMQGKLLRVLQEHRVCPVGASREEPVEVRVVAATNRDLKREVATGRFREDLYYRLAELPTRVPPLRERREDIPRLFQLFLRQETAEHPELGRLFEAASQLNPPVPRSFFERLLHFDWPGNIRHLRNVVGKVLARNLRTGSFVVQDDVLAELEPAAPAPSPPSQPATPARSEQERPDEATLLALLEEHDYVQRRVAQALGVSHTTVDRWMRELGLRRAGDLGAEEIEAAARECERDLGRMAVRLRVSQRGLKLRMKALGTGFDV
jgi:two-component system nitrogen regulation response regulator GlnG